MRLQTIAEMVKISNKLTATSFGTAHKDYAIFRFLKDNRLAIAYDFFENEKNKLFDKWGIRNDDGSLTIGSNFIADYQMAIIEILNTEITDFPILDLCTNDFEECKYSDNKDFWLCAADIAIIENYILEQKKRED